MFAFLGFIFFLLLLAVVAIIVNTIVQKSTYQASFSRGRVPDPLDGFAVGSPYLVYGKISFWKGVRFLAAEQRGVDIFTSGGAHILKAFFSSSKITQQPDGTHAAYPFATSVGSGMRDSALQVLKCDYNVPENPGLVRALYAEVVQIDPEKFLGKLYFQPVPGKYWLLGFFGLTKDSVQGLNVIPAGTHATIVPQASAQPSTPSPAPVPTPPVASVAPVVEPVASAPSANSGLAGSAIAPSSLSATATAAEVAAQTPEQPTHEKSVQ
jgi:hypothetical protein